LIDRNQNYSVYSASRKVISITIHGISSSRSRDTDQKSLCSTSKVPYVIDRSQPYLQCL